MTWYLSHLHIIGWIHLCYYNPYPLAGTSWVWQLYPDFVSDLHRCFWLFPYPVPRLSWISSSRLENGSSRHGLLSLAVSRCVVVPIYYFYRISFPPFRHYIHCPVVSLNNPIPTSLVCYRIVLALFCSDVDISRYTAKAPPPKITTREAASSFTSVSLTTRSHPPLQQRA